MARAARERAAALLRRWGGADRYIVGYPKCGNTWLQIMVRKALVSCYGLPETAMPRVLTEWRLRAWRLGVPAIGMTHHMPRFNEESYRAMRLDLGAFRGRNVVLLIREPKDMLVSLYMHNVHREQPPLYRGDVDAMVRDEVYGLDKYLAYYRAWDAHRHVPRALQLVRYEDLANDAASVLEKTLRFLELPRVTDALIRDAVAYGSFENMRKLEAGNVLKLPTLTAPPRTSDEAFKVRKGVVGDHVNHVSRETIRYVDQRVRAELPSCYGYAGADPDQPAIVGAQGASA